MLFARREVVSGAKKLEERDVYYYE